jgi:hypothetical protein
MRSKPSDLFEADRDVADPERFDGFDESDSVKPGHSIAAEAMLDADVA